LKAAVVGAKAPMPSVSKKPLSCGVEPSPTPTMPISGLSTTVTRAAGHAFAQEG